MDSKLWTKEFTWTRDGFCYTLNSTLLVGTSFEKDSIVIVGNNVSMHQVVYIHDPDFFIINDNPTALSKTRMKVMSDTFEYQRISQAKHVLLDRQKSHCEPRKDYSFRGCVRKSFADKVKCRLPWPSSDSSISDLPVCQNLSQFLQFENLYAQLEEMSTRSIERFTKCLRPCQYKEYRMVNSRVGLSHKFKNISSILMFWFVSTETLVEEQSFVYPWQSLVGFPTISLTLILPTN